VLPNSKKIESAGKPMTNKPYPVLCGCTFFTLLLQIKRDNPAPSERLDGVRSKHTERAVMRDLITIAQPEFSYFDDQTFKTAVSRYKHCDRLGSGDLPFEDSAFQSAFRKTIPATYTEKLKAADTFAELHLKIEDTDAVENLVRQLLDMILKDPMIDVYQEFYIQPTGAAVSRKNLRAETDICLPAFLLGLWYYIITKPVSNSTGKETIDQWEKTAAEKAGERPFCGLGKDVTWGLNISTRAPEPSPAASASGSQDAVGAESKKIPEASGAEFGDDSGSETSGEIDQDSVLNGTKKNAEDLSAADSPQDSDEHKDDSDQAGNSEEQKSTGNEATPAGTTINVNTGTVVQNMNVKIIKTGDINGDVNFF